MFKRGHPETLNFPKAMPLTCLCDGEEVIGNQIIVVLTITARCTGAHERLLSWDSVAVG